MSTMQGEAKHRRAGILNNYKSLPFTLALRSVSLLPRAKDAATFSRVASSDRRAAWQKMHDPVYTKLPRYSATLKQQHAAEWCSFDDAVLNESNRFFPIFILHF